MTSMIVKPPDDEHAYEQIEAAVMETSRGRWFLDQYARRNRHAETDTILDAIDRLQRNIGERSHAMPQLLPYDRLQGDIIEMARAIARTEREIRAIQPDGASATQFVSASDELDAVVGTTEQATSSILSAAERVQEYAWTMRETNGAEADCDMLDTCATEIYTACGFQDLTAQRIRKVVETLRFLDERLKSILEVTGMAEDFQADEQMISEVEPPLPVKHGSDIWMSDAHQAEIDDTFDFFVPAEISEPTMIGAELLDLGPESRPAEAASIAATQTSSTHKPAKQKPISHPAAAPAMKPSVPAESPYDGLSTEEKMRAFR